MSPAPTGPRVLHVASELYPLVKTGGLADVAASLPAALAALGADARVLVPGYPAVLRALAVERELLRDPDLFGGGGARLLRGRARGVAAPLYVLDAPAHYDRPGSPYHDALLRPHPDNHLRFAALCWAGARLALGADPDFGPEVVHGHDWQAGLVPAYLRYAADPAPPCVHTIHNLAYQGDFDAAVFPQLGLPAEAFTVAGVEAYGRVSYLKAALVHADRITTVSPTYAREILEPAHGHGLDGVLRARARDLVGILNGIDHAVWDPATDPALPQPFDARHPAGKARAKLAAQERFGLSPDVHVPLFVVVSRLAWHKGLDLLLGAAPALLGRGAQLAVLGAGEATHEEAFRALAAAHPRRAGAAIGHDEALAHLLQGGADVTLVPSRAEPCGLTQLHALRYGSLPLVRRTGGLADTVTDATPQALARGEATGFVFDEASVPALGAAIERACDLFADQQAWARVRGAAMSRDFGWEASARRTLDVYATLLCERAGA